VPMQLDGSAVKLKDYLNASDYDTLQQIRDAEQVMVTYGFNAMPHALQVAIPCTYDNTLFEQSGSREQKTSDTKSPVMSHPRKGDETPATLQHHTEEEESQASSQVHQEEDQEHGEHSEDVQKELPALVNALFEHGRKVSVVGKAPNAAKKDTYIIAGSTPKQSTGEMKPAAVVVNGNTTLFNHEGMHVSTDAVRGLQEGATIVVEGKKNKRGVIHASRVVL
jgi:hypothetical protein